MISSLKYCCFTWKIVFHLCAYKVKIKYFIPPLYFLFIFLHRFVEKQKSNVKFMNITKNSNSIFLFALKKYKNQKAKKCTKNSNNFCHQNSHALFLSHSSEITKQLRRNFKHFSNTRNLVFVSNKSFLNSLLCQLFMLFSSRT